MLPQNRSIELLERGVTLEGFSDEPLKIVTATAPIRICDIGGWTDTWFAEYGSIFNIGVTPQAEVQIKVYPRVQDHHIVIHAENYSQRYSPKLVRDSWELHPLLEAAVFCSPPPPEVSLMINIYSEAPAGASTGSSAAVTVALIGALCAAHPNPSARKTAHEVAVLAQQVETVILGRQCGIQDQLASAYGGINFINMTKYPHAEVRPIRVRPDLYNELDQRLVLIYLGVPHNSSSVHEKVIKELENAGAEAPSLIALRSTATKAEAALLAGDLAALGAVMIENTEYQRQLNAALVSPAADKVISVAQMHGALGWKVNGAGGDGGSITLLGNGDKAKQRQMVKDIQAADPSFTHIPVSICPEGLKVWESKPTTPLSPPGYAEIPFVPSTESTTS